MYRNNIKLSKLLINAIKLLCINKFQKIIILEYDIATISSKNWILLNFLDILTKNINTEIKINTLGMRYRKLNILIFGGFTTKISSQIAHAISDMVQNNALRLKKSHIKCIPVDFL